MKQGFATATVLLLIGLIAIFTIAVYVGNTSGFFSNASSAGDLDLEVHAVNEGGKAKVTATWKPITGAQFKYGLFKGSAPMGEPVIGLTSTNSNTVTTKTLDLEAGKYTFVVIAGRSREFTPNGITFNGANVMLPHVDRGPDGYGGGSMHGNGSNDLPRSNIGLFVDSATFMWDGGISVITPTPNPTVMPTLPPSTDKLDCTGLGFYTVGSKQNGAYPYSAPSVVQAKPGDTLYVASSLVNNTGQSVSGISNVYRFSGNANFAIADKDFCQVTSNKRVVCNPASLGANGIASNGVVKIKLAPNAQVGSTLTVKENLSVNGSKAKTQDCTQTTLSVVAQ